ncbi:MAG: hypothetical protein J0J04_07840 [Microbacterium sp.]|uniref:hypothetical protein n=1 Tax=Microbacterium sp. TaxID=51671 RepID=UPI001AC2C004|nr:hypothetical protein [Microbacterium sp.]MBN9214710.1 hypothetical protein [Microbacterium sp.]
MSDETTTFMVSMNETHTRVAIIVGDKAVGFRAHDALVISADILDAIDGCDPEELTPLTFNGLPRIATTAAAAREVAIAIARTADKVLVEADVKF